MVNTKIVIAIAAIAALALTAVGLAAAQIAQNQFYTPTATGPNQQAPNQGFWGWIGNCFGYQATPPQQGQYIAPPAATTPNATAPEPYQGGYGYNYGYGYGPCWARW